MSKPRIQYVDALPVVVGRGALVLLADGWVKTSAVQQMWPHSNGPLFETLNTIYAPPDTDETLPQASSKSIKA